MSDKNAKANNTTVCPYCKGKKTVTGRGGELTCPKCGGTGRAPKIETKG